MPIDELPLGIVEALTNGIGVIGITLLVFWLLATGRLATRREVDSITHDRDEWRAAHRISETARVELSGQVEELLEHAKTTDAFIRAIPNPYAPRGAGS